MAHKKAGGSTNNGRDSVSKRLGVKRFGGQSVLAGRFTSIVLSNILLQLFKSNLISADSAIPALFIIQSGKLKFSIVSSNSFFISFSTERSALTIKEFEEYSFIKTSSKDLLEL